MDLNFEWRFAGKYLNDFLSDYPSVHTFSFSSDLVRFFNKNFLLASWGWPLLKNKFLSDSTRLTLRLTVTSGGRPPWRSAVEDAAVCCDHVSSARLIMSSWFEQIDVGLWIEAGLGGVTTYCSFSEVGSLILIWSNFRPTRRPQVERPAKIQNIINRVDSKMTK